MPHPMLVAFPVVVSEAVSWGDMDSFRHVSNIVYFRYFQDARVEYMARVGWFESMEAVGVGPIVHSTNARFRRPVKYPDRVHIGARVIDLAADRVTFEHKLVSEERADVAADGQAVIVCFDYRANAKAAIPDAVRAKIEALEASVRK